MTSKCEKCNRIVTDGTRRCSRHSATLPQTQKDPK